MAERGNLPPVIDGHSDILIDVLHRRAEGEQDVLARTHVPKMRAGGVRLAFCPVAVDNPSAVSNKPFDVILNLDAVKQEVQSTEGVRIVKTAAEVRSVLFGSDIGLFLGLEGLKPVAGNPALIRTFYELGLRWAGLTWNDENEVAQGVGVADPAGLTPAGREVLREMNAVGMIIDLTHVSRKCFFEALELVSGPVIVSHSNANGVCRHPRNLDDDQIVAVARTGGTVGVNFFPRMVSERDATLEDVVRHVDYMVELVGIDHVAFGPDFIDYSVDKIGAGLAASSVDYGTTYTYPAGLEDTTRMPALLEALMERGYSREDVEKLAWRNLVRVIEEVVG